MPEVGAPAEKDWHPTWTTPIKDQGSCGSCVAFGVIGALESLLKIRTYKDPNRTVDLSEAHLLFCGGGSCGGWNFPPALDYLKNNGVPDEACFPYQPQNMPCSDTCADWKNRINDTKVKSWSKTLVVNDMKKRITDNGPQVGGMAVFRDFFYYKKGIYKWDGVSPLMGYHAITIVGFSDEDGCWICKNSWGTGWGEEGWFRIAYGQCGIDTVFGMYNMEVLPAKVCLIATAAYGSSLMPEVEFLKDIRDNKLRKTSWGNMFMDKFERIYYKFSPKIARTMEQNRLLRKAIRWFIVTPIVTMLLLSVKAKVIDRG